MKQFGLNSHQPAFGMCVCVFIIVKECVGMKFLRFWLMTLLHWIISSYAIRWKRRKLWMPKFKLDRKLEKNLEKNVHLAYNMILLLEYSCLCILSVWKFNSVSASDVRYARLRSYSILWFVFFPHIFHILFFSFLQWKSLLMHPNTLT